MICIYCAQELGLNQQYYHRCGAMMSAKAETPLASTTQVESPIKTKSSYPGEWKHPANITTEDFELNVNFQDHTLEIIYFKHPTIDRMRYEGGMWHVLGKMIVMGEVT